MKLGILSDTHDNLPRIEKAVKFFHKNRVDFVLHAGDFIAPFTIPRLDVLSCPWLGVFGNNDGERNGLSRLSGAKIKKGPLRVILDGRKVILVHDLKTISPKTENAQLVVFGHTHKPEILKKAGRLMVNPGECGAWLTGASTVALVDLDSLTAKIVRI